MNLNPQKFSQVIPFFVVLLIKIGTSEPIANQTKFMFFHGSSFDEHIVFNYSDFNEILHHEKYNSSQTTVLYIHGYFESNKSESVHLIVDAYLTRNDHNIIVLEWSEPAAGNYFFSAVPNAMSLGKTLAIELLNSIDAGLNITSFHLVGHSLGGQMAGEIGRNIFSKSKKTRKIQRISALDPASVLFYPKLIYDYLSKSDAKFVDIIHTDAGLYGYPYATGHADFWPNGGQTLQPGCPFRLYLPLTENDLCSHHRSFRFWADSVAFSQRKSFPSIYAKSWRRFQANVINNTKVVNMGIDCTSDARGDYYLQTNGQSPFSRGSKGLRYSK